MTPNEKKAHQAAMAALKDHCRAEIELERECPECRNGYIYFHDMGRSAKCPDCNASGRLHLCLECERWQPAGDMEDIGICKECNEIKEAQR